MSNVIKFGRHASIDDVMKDLNEMHAQGKLSQIHVIFQDNNGNNFISSVGTWGGLCIASVMMQEHAIKKGNE